MKIRPQSPILFLSMILLLCSLTACSFLGELGILPPTLPDGEPSAGTAPTGTSEAPPPNTDAPHVHTFDEWGSDENGHRQICSGCSLALEPTSHEPIDVLGTAPTCGKPGATDGVRCSLCQYILQGQEPIEPTGLHQFVSLELREPTLTEEGYHSGQECKLCHAVSEGTASIPAYQAASSNYAYNALAEKPNPDKLQSFYRSLLKLSLNYHGNATADATVRGEELIAVTAEYKSLGLTSEECFAVLQALQADCPLFYWINGAASTDGTYLYIKTDADYRYGDARRQYNDLIYAELLATYASSDTRYDRLLELNDRLTLGMDYAYDSNGQPSVAPWAHNIIGYFDRQSGVCETYAETFALFLNYWDIENVLVTGHAGGENHAWNLVQMEDGKWYWFDITWNDQPQSGIGRIYDYFCKTDAEFEMNTRTVFVDLYPLPENRATKSYTGSTPTVGTSFTSNLLTYSVIGYREVELTAAKKPFGGTLNVPAEVSYNGFAFRVTSVGRSENNTLYCVFSGSITSVNLPATLRYIRGNAFSLDSIESVTVAADNPYLVSDGVAIYRKDPCVLLCYLSSATAKSYMLREGTVGIESWAFIGNRSLETLVLPETLTFIRDNAFNSCPALSTLSFLGNTAAWEEVDASAAALNGLRVVCSDSE